MIKESSTNDPRSNLSAEASPARIDWLDGLRALAVGCVVLVHSALHVSQVPNLVAKICQLGQYGVQLFFVISALTIYFTLELHLGRNESVLSWYVRRFFRIAPIYYAAIVCYTAEHFLTGRIGWQHTGEDGGLRTILANVVFLHGWIRNGNNVVVPGGWSISVEMSFYVIAPLLFVFITRRMWWPAALAVVVPLCLVATYLAQLRASGSGNVSNNDFLYFWPLTQFPVFFLAIALAQRTRRWLYTDISTPIALVIWATIVGAAAFLLGAFCGTWSNHMHLLAPTLFGIGSCCLVLLARGQLKSFFANSFLVRIGGLSYSIYITHFIFLDALRFLLLHFSVNRYLPPMVQLSMLAMVTFALSAASSIVTRRLIEQPGVHFGARLARRVSGLKRAAKWPALPRLSASEIARLSNEFK
ncbi:MAG: acyltransferase [Terracidiphilus sp.]